MSGCVCTYGGNNEKNRRCSIPFEPGPNTYECNFAGSLKWCISFQSCYICAKLRLANCHFDYLFAVIVAHYLFAMIVAHYLFAVIVAHYLFAVIVAHYLFAVIVAHYLFAVIVAHYLFAVIVAHYLFAVIVAAQVNDEGDSFQSSSIMRTF